VRRSTIAKLILAIYLLLVGVSECQDTGVGVDPVMTRIRARGLLRVGYDPGTLPFTTMRDGQAAGYDIELARLVAARIGVAVEFVPVGLDAMYDELQQGHFDMIASAMPYAPEQGWRARFSEFYFDDGLMVVSRGTTTQPWQLQPAGVVFGSDADTYLRPLINDGTVPDPVYFDTAQQLWQALQCAEVAQIIVENTLALGMQQADRQIVVGPALTFAPLVMVVPYDALTLHDVVNQTLAQSKNDGTQQRLQREWFVMRPTSSCVRP
jgi:ABC-type amino acid transport substrate-binding protein